MTAPIDTFIRDRLPPADQQPEFRFDLPELQYPETLNAAVELIDRQDPDALALVNDAGRWTYGEMSDLSDRIARLLAEEEGLVPGNRVLLRGPNNAMLFASWLGILKAGGIVVATMPMLRGGEVATLLARAQVSHAIVDSRSLEDYRAGAAEAGTVRSLLTYDGDAGTGELERRLRDVAPGFVPVQTPARRRRSGRLHLGHDRQAQGLRPLSSRRPRQRRQLRPLRAEAAARRPLGLLGADRLHLRARHAARSSPGASAAPR